MVPPLNGLRPAGCFRYCALYGAIARSCAMRELMFRANFVTRCCMHVIWLALMLAFFELIFMHTRSIGDWGKYQYMLLLGTNLTLNALVNCLFIGGCSQFAEDVRTGSLDFAL